jgi:polyphosphate kinase
MHRNLDRRVEVLVDVPSTNQVQQLGELLDLGFDPGTASWWLDGDGEWHRHHREDGAPLRDLQAALVAMHRRRREG